MRWLLSHLILLLLLSPAVAQEQEPPEEPVELEAGKVRVAPETGGHNGHVIRLFFIEGGKQLVSVGKDSTIRYWDVNTGELQRTVRTALMARPESRNQAVDYLPGGSLMLCARAAREGDRSCPYVFLDPFSGRVEKKLEVETARGELSVAQSPDRKYLAIGNFDGVRVLDAETAKVLHQIKLPRSWGMSVAFTSDSKRLAALIKDQVHVINLSAAKEGKRKPVSLAVGKSGEVFSVIWSGDNRHILVATQQGIDVWDPQSSAKVKSHSIGKTLAMAWDADRRTLLTAGQGSKGKRARVSILNLESGKQQFFPMPAHEPDEAIDVAFSPDGQRVAAVAHERVIYIWSSDGGQPLKTIGTPIHSPIGAGWSKDGRTIAWGTRLNPDGRDLAERQPLQHLFDLAELKFVKGRDEPIAKKGREEPKKGRDFKDFHRAVFRQKGATLNVKHDATIVRGGETVKLATPFGQNTSGTLLSGDRAAINNVGGGIQLFDTKTGKRIRVLQGHSEPVLDMAPSPDGRYLLTASHDQTLKIWDVAEPGKERLLLTLFVRGQNWVIWTPEGYYAATPGGEELVGGTVHNSVGEIRTFYPAERFRKQLYRPDVIEQVLEKGSVSEALKVANEVRKAHNIAIPRGEAQPEKLLPPSVILEVVDQKKLPTVTVKVSAEQGCPEQPIKSLRLFIDGHPLPNRQATVGFDAGKEVARHAVTWEAEVPPGRHTLSAMARSKDDTPNFSNQIVFDTPLPEKDRPVVRHVAVGVSHYDRPSWNLRAAHSDAEQLADAITLATRGGKLYHEKAVVKKLVDPDATCENVRQAIKDVRQAAKPNDLFVFSFAGHGVREEGEFFLMTREADPTNAETLKKTALTGKELRETLADFPCQVLVLLDACHSGEVVKYRPGSDEAARALADVDVRVAVMCAALAHEEAIERNGGLFTAAIVKALKREGEVFFDKDTGELNVYHLQAFVYQEVTKASDAQQTPYLKMPLAQPAFVVAKFTK